MKPWNPYAMTFHGQPIVGQTPPKLVVYGPPLTAQQGAMLQTAYNAFVGAARVSIVPNPTRQGRLLDGSHYTIECSQGVCTCTVWTELSSDEDEDDRRSGIAIQFGDLSGEPLAAHGTTTYLLTPGVKKKTRVSTGKWKVRKLKEPMGGGKAVNADTDGTLYFAGVRGKDDEDYPLNYRGFGANERAITMEDTEAEPAMFRYGEVKCQSADTESPIPFVLTWEKKKYAAQLVFRHLAYASWEVDLRIGPMKQDPGEQIGTIVGTVTFPGGSTPRADKTSFRPDGQVARTQVYRPGVIEWGDFQITPTSIAYQSVGSKNMEAEHTYNYATPIYTIETEYFPGGGFRRYFEYNFNGYKNIGGEQVSRPTLLDTGTGEYKYRSFDASGIVYAFGPRGQEIYTENAQNTEAVSSYHNEKYTEVRLWSNADPSIPTVEDSTLINEYRYESHVDSGSSELTEFMGDDTEFTLRTRIHTSGTFIKKVISPSYGVDYYEHSGPGGTRTTETYMPGVLTPVFFDRYQEFAIVVEYVGTKTTSVMTTRDWLTIGSQEYYSLSSTTTPRKTTLIVKGRNGVVMRKALDPDVGHFFVAYSAMDPMTGALVVNLQKLKAINDYTPRERLESWIYVIDDTGVKTIQDLFPGLPENTCARRNHLLYSL